MLSHVCLAWWPVHELCLPSVDAGGSNVVRSFLRQSPVGLVYRLFQVFMRCQHNVCMFCLHLTAAHKSPRYFIIGDSIS